MDFLGAVFAAAVIVFVFRGRLRARRSPVDPVGAAHVLGPRENTPDPEERELYSRLLNITLGNRQQADALIEEARRYALDATRAGAIRAAVRRWEDDNR